MKIPKEVLVLGETYKVIRIKGLIEKDSAEGYADAHNFTIALDSSLKGRILARVFYHELAHCFAFEAGLHETMPHAAIEMFCQSFSNLVCNTILTK